MSQHPPQTTGSQLRDHLRVLRRRKVSAILVTAIVIAAAMLVSLTRTPLYRSEAEVLVAGLDLDPTQPGASDTPNLDTETRLASSLAVAELAAGLLGTNTPPADLLQGLSTESPRGTELLQIKYEHPDPLEAQKRAGAFTDAYLEFRRQQALDELLGASEAVRERITLLETELEETNRQIPEVPQPQRPALRAEAAAIEGQIAVLQQQLTALTPTEELRVGRVVQSANLPTRPTSPNHMINGSLALFLGLAFGIGVAFLRDRLDDRLRDRDELEEGFGAPVLAAIPRARANPDTTPIALADPKSGAAEAYRTLRTSLLFAASQTDTKTLLVTSANAEEGKTTTAANLGVSLANAGKRVVLVSADLRKPRLHHYFDAENEAGLTNVLSGEAKMKDILHRPALEMLRLLPSGPIPGSPAELLGSEEMSKLIAELRDVADFVLIDTAPVLAVADALILAPLVDAVLFVADADRTEQGAVVRARQQLDQVAARVIGAVLNGFDPSRDRTHPYYYRYYYTPEKAPTGRATKDKQSTEWI